MSDILMTNIFFMITALATIILTIVGVMVLVYIIKFIKKLNRITDAVENETIKILHDIDDVRESVKTHVKLAKGVVSATIIKKIIESLFTKK